MPQKGCYQESIGSLKCSHFCVIKHWATSKYGKAVIIFRFKNMGKISVHFLKQRDFLKHNGIFENCLNAVFHENFCSFYSILLKLYINLC